MAKRKTVGDIQNLVVETRELTDLVQEINKDDHEDGQTDWYTAVAILANRYKGDPDRAFCVLKRIECLLALMKEPRMRGWSVETTEPGCVVTHHAAFEAAARCPLRLSGDHFYFNPDEFFRIALEKRAPEGSV